MAGAGWPRLGVGALVLDGKGRVLLVRRKYPPFPGLWSIPGGHVEPGETVIEAAARELREETGVEADPVGVVDIHELIVYENGRLKHHYLILDVLFQNPRGRVKPSSDALDAGFFDLPVTVEVTPTVRKLLDKLVRGQLARPTKPEKTVCVDGVCG